MGKGKSHRRNNQSSDPCRKCKRSKCSCQSSSSSSTPECQDSNCEKICFGHWGAPQCSKCKKLTQYTEYDFDKIPTGSIWFGWDMTPIGALISLATKQCYNRVGIVIQVKQKHRVDPSSSDCNGPTKCYTRVPYVYTISYNGCVELVPLRKLAYSKTIRRMAVRPIKPTCNECTDEKRSKNLVCIMKEYLGKNYDRDGASVMRNIFNLDVINPNYEGFNDTKLVYAVLNRNAVLKPNGCCEESTPSCSTEYSAGRSDSLTCESRPCESTCCESSSECEKCEVDWLQASNATLTDFLYDKADGCLDMRWFSALVPVWSECATAGHDLGVDKIFCEQKDRLIRDLRQLVSCWSSGQAVPCAKQCRDQCGKPEQENVCKVSACDVDTITGNLDLIYTWLSGVNYANITPIPTTLDGNQIAGLLNQILSLLCVKCNRYLISSSYLYPSTGGITVNFTAPLTPPLPQQQNLFHQQGYQVQQNDLSNSMLERLIGTYGQQ